MDPREFLSRTLTPLGEVRIEKFLARCHRELCPDRPPHSYRLLRHKGGRHAAPELGLSPHRHIGPSQGLKTPSSNPDPKGVHRTGVHSSLAGPEQR